MTAECRHIRDKILRWYQAASNGCIGRGNAFESVTAMQDEFRQMLTDFEAACKSDVARQPPSAPTLVVAATEDHPAIYRDGHRLTGTPRARSSVGCTEHDACEGGPCRSPYTEPPRAQRSTDEIERDNREGGPPHPPSPDASADTRRIDWLIANPHDIVAPMRVPELGITPWVVTSDSLGEQGGIEGPSLRAALDAAMRATNAPLPVRTWHIDL